MPRCYRPGRLDDYVIYTCFLLGSSGRAQTSGREFQEELHYIFYILFGAPIISTRWYRLERKDEATQMVVDSGLYKTRSYFGRVRGTSFRISESL